MTIRVVHRTTYTYGAAVSVSYGEAHLLPRDLAGQIVRAATLDISPPPDDLRERVDYFGNRTHHFALHGPHTRLEVTATSIVEVTGRGAPGRLLPGEAWDVVAGQLADPLGTGAGTPELLEASEFALASPHAAPSRASAAYARPSFPPGRPLLEAVEALCSRIHRDVEFRPGSTTVGTPVDHVLTRRTGVCQDFAHLTISALRSMGLAARYVSGYLETDPPPGAPKVQGADVSHAWPSVFVPEVGWVDMDPTNDQVVNDRYVTTAWGRDYGDVAPLNGVIFTDGDTRRLEVSVDVRRITGQDVDPADRA